MSTSKMPAARSIGPSDSALLGQIAEGHMGALGVLYDRYAPSLLRFARRVEPREAEDIVQMVFLRVVRLATVFDRDAASARPWLFAITSRVTQERKRAFRRFARAMARMSDQPPRTQGNVSDTRRDLDRGLARLSVEKRTVLVLAEVEGFAGEEIAAMLSIPIGTVWTRLHHARRELRRYQEEGRS
jgi:RNA polymerase sigma-70 factor (ECF subfamily)